MRPRRTALLLALVAGFVVAGLAAARILEPAPLRHDMHERYRVAFDLPPVEAALWFAARYPEYFTSGEAGLGPWLDELDPRDRDFVLAMGQTLTWAWVEHELASFPRPPEPAGVARAATTAVRQKTLNQLELNVDHFSEVDQVEFNAYLGARYFVAGAFARLVRGVNNCEGQNHLAAILLETALEPSFAALPKAQALMTGSPSGHELVVLEGMTLAQPIYVDAWSNLPAFTLDPERPREAPLLSELGDEPRPIVPGAAWRAPEIAANYLAGSPTPIPPLSDRRAPTKEVDLEIRAPKLDAKSLARVEDPWRIYLYARILHIYDDPRAAELYRVVQERDCGEHAKPRTFLCAASTLFLARLPER